MQVRERKKEETNLMKIFDECIENRRLALSHL